MPAHLQETDALAIKIVSVFPENLSRGLSTIHAIVIALDAKTGQPIALLEGASLTAIRTGAASGAATELLAREESRKVAIFGSGVQARTQLEAVCTVRPIDQVVVYSLDEPGAQSFLDEMAGVGPIPSALSLADSPSEAIREADIICTATTSSQPVFSGNELAPGTHINAIGSFTPQMQEVDSETVKRAVVVVDSLEATLAEAGDLIIPMEKKLISSDHIHGELGEIVSGRKKGRSSPQEITLFKSVGIAVQDAAAASRALAYAQQQDLGTIIQL
jgi:ornithine cyclodeaminase